jgi:ABC-type Mn2+/Zn2+ transport system permease subunit
MMVVGAAIGAVSSVAGLYISFYVNVSSGAAVVLTCTVFFIVAFLFAPQRGAVWSWLRSRRSRAANVAGEV